MNDVFNEQLVARKANQTDLIKRIAIGAAGAVVVFVALNIEFLSLYILPIAVIIVALVVYLMRQTNVEFEYIFTNGELDIDRIVNKSRRKNVLSIQVKSFETMVPVMKGTYENEVSNYTKLLDFGSGVMNANTYAVIFERDKQRYKMLFEPNEQMFKAIRAYIPRVIKN